MPSEFDAPRAAPARCRAQRDRLGRGAIHGWFARKAPATADEATRQVKGVRDRPQSRRAHRGRPVRIRQHRHRSRDWRARDPDRAARAARTATRPCGSSRTASSPSAREFGVVDEAHDRHPVLSGLAEGETVVTGPVEGFADGQAVRVTGKDKVSRVPLRPFHQAAGAGHDDGAGARRTGRLQLPAPQRGPVPRRGLPFAVVTTTYPGRVAKPSSVKSRRRSNAK